MMRPMLDMIVIVECLQVMPFQLGCVSCAGVILPAGGFHVSLSPPFCLGFLIHSLLRISHNYLLRISHTFSA